MADDLNQPLRPAGGDRRPRRLRISPLAIFTGLLGCAVVAALVWTALVDNPLGGEPIAIARIENAQKSVAAPTAPAVKVETPSAPSQTVTIIDGKSGSRTVVSVGAGDAGAEPAFDPRLVENSPHGSIPRMAADGARPLDVYASAGMAAAEGKGPRVAIVVAGLGTGANVTSAAFAQLPTTVTFAFAPYGDGLSGWLTRARSRGHEALLQIPMEPFDYPDNDPGPRTLMSNLPGPQNIDRLHWFLSRTQGYIGVTALMGGRFTSSESALAPVLTDIGKRGLLYFDDGASPRSVARKAAADAKAPFLRADIVIDAKPGWAEIDAALDRLERLAVERGTAVGMAGALPVSIERIARWAKAAEQRGIRIVPLSALAPKPKQS